MKTAFLFLACILLICMLDSNSSGQIVLKAKGEWYSQDKKLKAGDWVKAGDEIVNKNRSVPNRDFILVTEDSCYIALRVDCKTQNCNETFRVSNSNDSTFGWLKKKFTCTGDAFLKAIVRGDDILGIDGIVEIKNGRIAFTQRIKLLPNRAGTVYISPLCGDSSDIVELDFNPYEPFDIKIKTPNLYKLTFKSDEYHILALQSKEFVVEKKEFAKILALAREWKEQGAEHSLIISLIWKHLDYVANKYNLPNEKKKKEKSKNKAGCRQN